MRFLVSQQGTNTQISQNVEFFFRDTDVTLLAAHALQIAEHVDESVDKFVCSDDTVSPNLVNFRCVSGSSCLAFALKPNTLMHLSL